MWNESPLKRVYVWVHTFMSAFMHVCVHVSVCACVCSSIPFKDRKSGRKYTQKSNYQRPLKNGNRRE